MKKVVDVELEIGENLFLRIDNVSYVFGRSAYISGRPEDCYEADPPEINWNTADAKIVLKKYKLGQGTLVNGKYVNRMKLKEELVFPVPEGFDSLYYDQILDYIEEV